MSFLERLSSLRRLKCTSVIKKGPQSVSFIERLSLNCTREGTTKYVIYRKVVLSLEVKM